MGCFDGKERRRDGRAVCALAANGGPDAAVRFALVRTVDPDVS